MNGQPGLATSLVGEAAQTAFGARLAKACRAPLLVYLQGDLGTGKTTLTRGLLRGLGHQGAVKSPTYTLVEPYEIDGERIYHLDLYRVGDPGELEYLGLREMLADHALILIEWPERGEGWLPSPDLWIRLRHRPDGRNIELQGVTDRGGAVISELEGF
jgi:tRNA threonylcarbamoyladenosine biosynthesis protein TsaE